MAEAILYGIAHEVLKNLGSTAVREIVSAWGSNDQLESLERTINDLKDVMLDAEERQADSHAVRGWFEKLTTVIYDADDLFDECATLAARKQQFGGNKMTREVHTFFSSSNQIATAFKISHKIKRIKQHLDGIDNEGKKFSFVRRPHDEGRVMHTSRQRDQSYSFVDADEIIGRDDDKKAVLDLLLPSSNHDENEVLPVISIVGMGGMGKTALAKLVYNDPQVQDYFELKLWVCVSDAFNCKTITEKILMSKTKSQTQNLDMDPLQTQLREQVGGKKYLLVLDDVWNESREEWLKVRDLLNIGRKGSKILVTARSKAVADIMGTSPPHELKGLSEEKSWDLFEKMAFKRGQVEQSPQLVMVGKEIIKKCGSVPLAIRSLGSILYGKEESKWLSIKDTSLPKIVVDQGDIMKILRFSYDYLSSPLKNCFAYCSLFPKDHVFRKERLIELWMAEGFIAANEGQCLEDVGEEYFLIFLQRGFFQEWKKWRMLEICKMHDLMHDLAVEVAGCRCKVAKFDEKFFDDKTLHLSFADPLNYSPEIPIHCFQNLKRLRTFLAPKRSLDLSSKSISLQLLTRFSNLRVLDLNEFGLKSLPSSIGKLIHLRYLDLCENKIEKLPDSITNLWNLQTLRLFSCNNLRALPANLRKLANLRSLDVGGCDELTHMPSGLERLTLLSTLPLFIVGHGECSTSKKCKQMNSSAKLSDLKSLNNLRGVLCIDIHIDSEKSTIEATEADLSCKHGLTELLIVFSGDDQHYEDIGCDHDEIVLEGLKPPSNLSNLRVSGYKGKKLPRWARMDNLRITLPNLVRISLSTCISCHELPILSQLPFLKELELQEMDSVEYMEGDISSSLFFPSLEKLWLYGMKNLKGWWKEGEAMESNDGIEGQLVPISMQFSKLSSLIVKECPSLRMLPLCPNVENLELRKTNERLAVSKIITTMMMSSCSEAGCKLKELEVDNAEDLMFLPSYSLHQLFLLKIDGDRKLESTERLGEVFANLPSSVRIVEFWKCERLSSIAKGLENLTALENLRLFGCQELDLTGKGDEDDAMPWRALNSSLRSLSLGHLSKLVGLPNGLQHLTNLCSFRLSYNSELKELPEWIGCLTSLKDLNLCTCPKLKSLPEAIRNLTALNQLEIMYCPGLTARCQRPNGSDWPKIQHIPSVNVRDWN